MTSSKFKIHPFGKYVLLEEVASGGMAIVYKALGKTIDGKNHYFAIKRILPNYASDEEFISLLKDEAKLMVQLNHPNIVSLIEFGKVEDDYYISMEYIEGTTLKGMIQRVLGMKHMFTVDMATHIIREIATGLSYAHRKIDQEGKSLEIVHRDISPANILISYEGEVKITDFGISKASTQTHFTQSGIIRGKTGYMSPEQTRSDIAIDNRSDLFSLGVIFYELLSGKKLFYAKSIPESIRMVREGNVPPITTFRPDVPKELEKIILKILDLKPEQRYQKAEDFMDALNEFLTRYAPAGRPVRITHVDLIGFMKRFYPQEMFVGSRNEKEENDSLMSLALSDASEKEGATEISKKTEKAKTFANNPLYDISSPIDPPSLETSTTIKSGKFRSGSLVDASEGEVASFPRKNRTEITEVDGGFFTFNRYGKWIVTGALMLLTGFGVFSYQKHQQKTYQLVEIRSEPTGAKVTLDGVVQSQTTPGEYQISKQKNTIDIKIEKKGFQNILQTRRLSDLLKPVTFRLEQDRSLIATSKVLLNTDPSQVEIVLDGKKVEGSTPMELELEVGKTYKLTFEKEGYNSKDTTLVVDVPGNIERTVVLTVAKKETPVIAKPQPKVTMPSKLGKPETKVLKPGSVSITSNPWTYVELDGKKVGETPLVGISTSSGKHKLKIYNPEFNIPAKEISITIQAGKHLRCTYDLGENKIDCF